MSLGPLPEHVDARRLFAQNAEIRALVELASLSRLCEYLVEGEGTQIEVQLDFSQDESRQRRLTGTIKTKLQVRCERCLQPMELFLQVRPELLVASDEQECQLLEEQASQEVVICEDGQLALLALIEDELILSLPLVPTHSNSDCNAVLKQLQDEAEVVTEGEENNDQPFADLKRLKGQLKK